jgi:uncharacterized protein (DUF924 family)
VTSRIIENWPEAVLSFWFGLEPEQWWRDTGRDELIRERFEALWDEQRGFTVETFLDSPRGALAAVIGRAPGAQWALGRQK